MSTDSALADYPSANAARAAMVILMISFLFSYVDRSALLLLVDPVRADLGLTDWQIGLLSGPAFGIVYTLATLPLTRLGDIWSRKYTIAGAMLIWGAMTIACGLSHSFGQLAMARTGVGLGEAALTANAFTLAAELNIPDRRGRAIAIFALGASLGGGIALIAGGAVFGLAQTREIIIPVIGALAPWRAVLVVVGVMTILWAAAILLIPERAALRRPAEATRLALSVRHAVRNPRAYAILFIGMPLNNLAFVALATWAPTYFIRDHGWSAPDTGKWLGWSTMIAVLISTVAAGVAADAAKVAHKPSRGALLLGLPFLAAVPCVVMGAWTANAYVALVGFALFSLLAGGGIVLGPLCLQLMTPPALRGGMTALYLLVGNLVGIGIAAPLVVWVSERIFHGPYALGHAIGLVCGVTNGVAALAILWGIRDTDAVSRRAARLEAPDTAAVA